MHGFCSNRDLLVIQQPHFEQKRTDLRDERLCVECILAHPDEPLLRDDVSTTVGVQSANSRVRLPICFLQCSEAARFSDLLRFEASSYFSEVVLSVYLIRLALCLVDRPTLAHLTVVQVAEHLDWNLIPGRQALLHFLTPDRHMSRQVWCAVSWDNFRVADCRMAP